MRASCGLPSQQPGQPHEGHRQQARNTSFADRKGLGLIIRGSASSAPDRNSNLACNMRRLAWLDRRAAPAGDRMRAPHRTAKHGRASRDTFTRCTLAVGLTRP